MPEFNVEEAKKKYGEIYSVKIGDSKCFLKQPNRKDLSRATAVGGNDAIKFNEILLEACFIGGDESFKTDDSKFFAIGPVLADLIKFEEAEVKKL